MELSASCDELGVKPLPAPGWGDKDITARLAGAL
jgi:hypothetical protein